jgi:Spy/CpxP family protein refolding chaperone
MTFSTRLIAAAAAALALGVGGLALAQQTGTAPQGEASWGHHRMHGPVDPAQIASHLEQVKATLQITPTQEVAWQNFTQVLLTQAQARQAQRAAWQAAHQDPSAAAPTDRSAQRAAMKQQFEADRAQREAARKELFTVLSPEQQALALKQLPPHHGQHGGMHHPAS